MNRLVLILKKTLFIKTNLTNPEPASVLYVDFHLKMC